MARFKKVIGAIDGSHIPIQGQGEHNEAYINRKGFPRKEILQAVCDLELNFTDCFVGWPGSVHDSCVFKNSPLCNSIQNNPFEMFPNDTHLLGDAAYPLETFLLTPYKGLDYGSVNHASSYNKVHASTRNVIERAFGILKSRSDSQNKFIFKRLKKFVKLS